MSSSAQILTTGATEQAATVEELNASIVSVASQADQRSLFPTGISIEEINQALSQVSAVVQSNAATAEESSASSEELAAQAQILHQEVVKFQLTETASED